MESARVLNGGIWLKRGDVHASVTADVQWVDSVERLDAGMADFARRGIAMAALQTHRAGDEIKFYGVADGGFFHWFYSGEARKYPFDFVALENLAQRAARLRASIFSAATSSSPLLAS